MKPKRLRRLDLQCWLALVVLGICFIFSARPVAAQSIYDYFEIDLDIELSEDDIRGDEVFQAFIDGIALCEEDLPLTVDNGYVTSRIVAKHRESGDKVTLNSSYTITIDPFPNQKGEATEASVIVPLKFPGGSEAGRYEIVGELITAKVVVVTDEATFSIPVSSYLPQSEDMGMVSYTPGTGGGTIEVGPVLDLIDYDYINDDGVFTEDFIFQSEDGICQLEISEGTTGLTEDGEPLSELTIREMADPPALPADYGIVGIAYDLGPDGATFDPPIILTFNYDDLPLPQGVSETDLVVALWHEQSERWVFFRDSLIDTGANTISVSLNHFTSFALFAHLDDTTPVPNPVNFTITNLAITPVEVNPGEEVTISALLTNTGDLEGSYQLVLMINDITESTGEITLAGGEQWPVTFTVIKEVNGTYVVELGGLSGTFEVTGAPSGPETPTTPTAPTNWGLIGGIIAAAVIGITVPLVLRRRKNT